jgi:geranylgeranyl pyrophosphate synthase
VAVELAHAFSLVHDDLPCLDDSPTRRGQPSVHRRFDEATALLAGDALLALAFELLADPRRRWPRGTGERMVAVLAQAIGRGGMIGGQAAEQELLRSTMSPRALARVHALKTGRLFEAAALLGGLAAGAPPSGLAALVGYARPLGLAFQIADDLLDAAEDGARAAGTYPGVLGLANARRGLARAEAAAITAAGRFSGQAERLGVDLARYAAGRRR